MILVFISFSVLGVFLTNNACLRTTILQGKVRRMGGFLIYETVLKTSSATLSEGMIAGKIANVITSDFELFEGCITIMFLLSVPGVVVSAIIILGFVLGPAGVIGVIISVFHIPLITIIGKVVSKIRFKMASFADSRIKLTSNLIECIKIVKLYGWEHPFLDKIFF